MKRQRHTIVPSTYLILRDKDNVLLMRRANTGYMDGMYSLPSGHVEEFEPAELATIREAKEEIGVDVKVSDLQLVYVLYRKGYEGDHERVCLFFEATIWKNEIKNHEPHKCDDVRWFAMNDLPENMAQEVKYMFSELVKGKLYSSYNYLNLKTP